MAIDPDVKTITDTLAAEINALKARVSSLEQSGGGKSSGLTDAQVAFMQAFWGKLSGMSDSQRAAYLAALKNRL